VACPALGGIAAGGVSAQAQQGICEVRKAAVHAERAVEALNDAIAWEADPQLRALLENARIAALYLLVSAAHVAAGHDIRSHAKTITRYADKFGRFKGEAEAGALVDAAGRPFHEWASAGGVAAPAPIPADHIEPKAGKAGAKKKRRKPRR
jgi:hypothetical protein